MEDELLGRQQVEKQLREKISVFRKKPSKNPPLKSFILSLLESHCIKPHVMGNVEEVRLLERHINHLENMNAL